MRREEIQKEMEQLSEAKQKVLLQLEKATREREQADVIIKGIDERLPSLLAGIALKTVPSSKGMKEIGQIKREKARQNGIVDNYRFLKAGLESELKKYSQHRFEVLTRKMDRWNEYDRLKEEMLVNPSDRHHHRKEVKLLGLAAHPDLGCLEDAQAFLDGLKKQQN